jgi:hypothetical protein
MRSIMAPLWNPGPLVLELPRIHLPRIRVNKAPGLPWLTALDPPATSEETGRGYSDREERTCGKSSQQRRKRR